MEINNTQSSHSDKKMKSSGGRHGCGKRGKINDCCVCGKIYKIIIIMLANCIITITISANKKLRVPYPHPPSGGAVNCLKKDK